MAGIRAIYALFINLNLTIVISRRFSGIGIGGTGAEEQYCPAMAKLDETNALSWPWWAPRALLAVALTSLLTIAVTLYDIL